MPLSESSESLAERKMSTGSMSPERRMRTRSQGEQLMREYVGDAMDKHLRKLNLEKKLIAKDSTSIFRAVCEQISSVQTDHESLRKLVETILRPIAQRHFKEHADHEHEKYDRDHEIFKILSEITSSRIKVYGLASDEPRVYEGAVVEEGREISVCESPHRSVFEPVYTQEMHDSLCISQSIIYRSLYEGVYGCTKEAVDEAISFIQHDIYCHSHPPVNGITYQAPVKHVKGDNQWHAQDAPCNHKRPAFPFCACKSLSPSIYRNVDYDMHQKKKENTKQAERNSQAVKFGVHARCLTMLGGLQRSGIVVQVVNEDVRRVVFDGQSNYRDFNVNDLRVPPSSPLMYLPGCVPPQYLPPNFNRPPPPLSPQFNQQGVPPFGFGPPPPGHFGPPPSPLFGGGPMQQQQQHFFHGGAPPPLPTPSSPGLSMSPAPLDSTLDNSVFSAATPLSSRKNEEGRRGRESNKKPRALSSELSDSPASKVNPADLTWYQQPKGRGGEKRSGTQRRATEGDGGAEMPRPLQPKTQQLQLQPRRLSTCGSASENDSPPALPSVGGTPVQQQLQQNGAAAAVERKNLPSVLNLPQLLPRPRHSSSSEYTAGDDAVFDEPFTNSQMSLANDMQQLSMQQAAAVAAASSPRDFNIPDITFEEYNQVILSLPNANYSKCLDGSDLPKDMLTLRFLHNMGLQACFRSGIISPPADALPMPPPFSAASPFERPGSSAFQFPPIVHQLQQYPMTPMQPSAPPPTPLPVSSGHNPMPMQLQPMQPVQQQFFPFQSYYNSFAMDPMHGPIPYDPNVMGGIPQIDLGMMLQPLQPVSAPLPITTNGTNVNGTTYYPQPQQQ